MYQSDDYYHQSNGQFSQVSRPAPGPMNKVVRYYGSQSQPRLSGGFNQYGGLDEPQDEFGGNDTYAGPQDDFGEYRGSQDRYVGHDSFGGSQNQFSEEVAYGSQSKFGGPDEFSGPSNKYGMTGGFRGPQEQYGTSGSYAGPQGQNRSPGGFNRPQGQIRASGTQSRPRGGFNSVQGQSRPTNPYRAQVQRAAPGPQVRPQGQNRVNPYSRPENPVRRQNSGFDRPQWNNPIVQDSRQANASVAKPKFAVFNKSTPGYQDRLRRAPQTAIEYSCNLCDVTCRTKFIFDQHLKGKGHQKKVKRKEIEKLWEDKDPSAYCSICELTLDPSVMDAHLRGEKHKLAIEKKTKEDMPPSEKGEEQEDEQAKDGKVSGPSVASRGIAIKCDLCSVTLRNLPAVSRHFNSREHMTKCAEKCNAEKKGASVTESNTTTTTPAAGENPFYCKICDLTLTGQTPYNAHINGYKHNYKLTNGNFDPSSPFFAKSMKRKEEMQKTKEKLEKRRLMRRAKSVKSDENKDDGEGEKENGEGEKEDGEGEKENGELENVEAAAEETCEKEGN